MKKIISYRKKLEELSKIYQVSEILNNKSKLTTYDIEILLLKNNVPIPSRKSYFTLKLSKEIIKPLFSKFKNLFNYKFNFSRPLSNIEKSVKNYFTFIFISIKNFYKIIFNTIIDGLNNVYNFRVKESIFNKLISRAGYISLIIILGFGVFYVKELVTNLDLIKFSLEIKSDKKNNKKDSDIKLEVVKKTEKIKNPSKKEGGIKLNKQENSKVTKLQKKKSNTENKKTKDKKMDTSETDVFELNAATVVNLFEDLEYNLNKVRNDKKIQPIYFTRLPKDIDSIKSSKRKKELFLQIVLPLIVTENEKIIRDKEYLMKILAKTKDAKEKKWINKKFKEYKISDKDVKKLISRMDIIPVSIALAQAAKESGWGTSRFALEGNAIFGQWTWNGNGIKPLEINEDQTHTILRFPILRASVKAYIANLNTHNGYKDFRKNRLKLRKNNKQLKGLDLIHGLDKYAQTGKQYTLVLEKIIKQNSLDDFENVSVLDNKNKQQYNL
jgi:Bax protein